jgi:hypothetical protein
MTTDAVDDDIIAVAASGYPAMAALAWLAEGEYMDSPLSVCIGKDL